MNKLSIEEKAKAYDEAIKVAKEWHTDAQIGFKSNLEKLFPELKESEDEKIRKALIYHYQGDGCICTNEYRIDYKDICAWLEKQGEQKPAGKVEPKFKIGDWIIFNVKEVVNGFYRTTSIDDIPNSYDWDIDNAARLWTIEDAKDGDVLCCESGWTCVFKALNSDISFSSYCFMDDTGWFYGTGSESHTLDKAFIKAYSGNIYPATKEQRDILMKAMADAGYTFDFEKKELKKIEQKSVVRKFRIGDTIKHKSGDDTYYTIVDIVNDSYICNNNHSWSISSQDYFELIEQKPAWSEEDENMLKDIITDVKFEGYNNDMQANSYKKINWLKSLKDRVQPQPKQEWSEEDENIRLRLIDYLYDKSRLAKDREDGISWLKSLRPQSQWKPSDEQIYWLKWATGRMLDTEKANEAEAVLEELLEQLKKLMEE